MRGTTINLGGTTTISGDLNIAVGTLDVTANNYALNVAGNWTNSGTFTPGTGTVDFTKATGTQTLNSGGTASGKLFNNVLHSGAGTLQLLTNNINIDGNFTNSAGTFDTNSLDMTVAGSWNGTGGTFTKGTRTVTFDGAATGKTINPGTQSFYNLTFNGAGGAWSPLTNTVTVTADLTMTAGTFNTAAGTASVTVNGNVACGVTCGTIDMTTAGTNTFTQNVAAAGKYFGTSVVADTTQWKFYNLTFTRSTGTLTITTSTNGLGDITVNNVLNIAASTTFAAGNRTYHLMGSGTPFTRSGTFTYGTSTMSYENTTSANIGGRGYCTPTAYLYYNLQTSPASGTPTYTLKTGGTSFLAGTKVKVENGEKNIEDIKVGDKVLSYDINTNKSVMSEVTDITSGSKDAYYIINGKIKATGNHIFILPDNSQKAVEDMKVGDVLKTYTGEETVRTIEKIDQTISVYDIGVEKYHLFFAENYLVHNTVCDGSAGPLVNNDFTIKNGGGNATVDAETDDPRLAVNGNFSIEANQTFLASSARETYLSGNFINAGTFTAGTGSVTFKGTTAGHTINTGGTGVGKDFYNLFFIGTGGAWSPLTNTLTVTNILNMSAGTLNNVTGSADVVVNGTVAGTAGIINMTAGTFTQRIGAAKNFGTTSTSTNWIFNNLNFENSSAGGLTVTTAATATGQIIVGGTLTVGNASDTNTTTLDNETNDRIIDANGDMTITSKGALSASSTVPLTIGGNYLNAGTLTANSGTITFDKATDTQTLDSGGVAAGIFNNITHNGAGTLQLVTNNLNIDGNFVNDTGAGTFDANGLNMNVADDFLISGGSFSAGATPGTQTVTFDGTNEATVSGSTTFNNLTMDSSVAAKTIKFTAGTTQTISSGKTWTLDGAIGNVLTLRSTSDTNPWTFDISAPFTSGDYIDVKDSYSADANKITPGTNVTNSGNNDGWIFNQGPNVPTLLGPASYVDGAWQTDNTPTLTFNLSDPDGADQVKYEIIISTHSDFSSPTIDYTSGLDAQGARNYTADPALSDGIYYWEVKTVDASNVSSSYTIAGDSGTADIKVDTTVPTTDIYLNPTNPNGTNSYYKTTAPTVTFTSDDGTGSGASTVYYRWGATGDFSAYSAGISAPEGTNTIYYYGTDLAGNSGVASPFSREIKTDTVTPTVTATADPVGPNGSNNYYTGTAPTITLSSTDTTSGLLNIQYKWDSGSYATYSTPLTAAEGTHTLYYYATDNAGNTGASSPGSTVYNVDTGIPTVSVVADPLAPNGTNGYYITTAPTITLSALDTGDSGVAFIQYKWDSGSYATYSTPLVAASGTHTLHYYSIDTAGNNSAEANEIFKTDLTNPTVDIFANPTDPDGGSGYYETVPVITFTGSDSPSGLENIYYHWDSNGDSTYTTGFNAPEGHHIIHYYAKDNAGNQTADITRDYYVDTTLPTVSTPAESSTNPTSVPSTATNNPQTSTGQDHTSPVASFEITSDPSNLIVDQSINFDATRSSDNIGITRYQWDFGDGETANSAKVDHRYQKPGRYIVKLTVFDKDGNKAEKTQTVNIKPTVPTISNIYARGEDIIVEGKAFPKTLVYLTFHSNNINGEVTVDKSGKWQYTLAKAIDVLGEGDHTVFAISAVKLAGGSEIRGSQSKTYDFKVTLDNGKLKVEMRKTKIWQLVSLGLGTILLIALGFVVYKRKKRG